MAVLLPFLGDRQTAEIPSNDKCSGAVSVGTSLPFSYSGSMVGATPDSIEGAVCAGVSDVIRGVWFRFVAGPNSRNQLITVTVDGSSFGTYALALFGGSCDNLTCVHPEGNPTDDVFIDYIGYYNGYYYNYPVSFVPEAGQTYSILLQLTGLANYGDFGTYNITVLVSLSGKIEVNMVGPGSQTIERCFDYRSITRHVQQCVETIMASLCVLLSPS
jgi:hypothetical protein